MTRLISVILALAAVPCLTMAQDSPLAAAAKQARESGRAPALNIVEGEAPELQTRSWFNAEPTTLRQLRGRVVLIDFWATWCGPCVKSLPEIERIAAQFRNQDFTVILLHSPQTTKMMTDGAGVARPERLPAEKVLPEFLAEKKVTVPVAVSGGRDFPRYGARAIPLYVVVDKRGIVRYARIGKMPDEAFLRALLSE